MDWDVEEELMGFLGGQGLLSFVSLLLFAIEVVCTDESL